MTLVTGDRIDVMHEGRIEQEADPNTISNLPENVQVAAFMGDNNIFEGTVTSYAGDSVSIDGGETELRVLASESDAAVGQPAAVSVRAAAVDRDEIHRLVNSLPDRERHAVGPWVFLDHFGPYRASAGAGGGAAGEDRGG